MAELKNKEINIEDIKSSYIKKEIFSLLDQKKILSMIIYNKKLQKLFAVNIEDYKKISGKYMEGEKNGEGKEYGLETNRLIFEGKYLNGKRNGKGKEYDYNGKLKFEGEYLNGERNGKAIEYYDNDKLKFEGEYLNGKRWNGKGYNEIGRAHV